MSKNARPLGEMLGSQVLGQRLGGDDVAADRDDPAAQRRDDAVGVAVGGDEHVAGEDRAALGLDDEAAVGLAADRPALGRPRAGRRRPGRPPRRAPRSSGRDGAGRCPGRRAPRSRRPMPISSRSARAGRRSSRRPTEARLSRSCSRLGHVRRRVGELEVADLAEVAVDRFVGDQPLDRLVAGERLAVERRGRSPRRSA